MRRNIFCFSLALVFFVAQSCDKEPVCMAPPFEGDICTEQEVDLGLSARWAGYNVGASAPQEYGNWFSWGETQAKQSYSEENYTKPAGNVVAGENDVASREWGYGWHLPSVENIQELIDNCDISFASYKGVDGWAVTSRVAGYEGKTVFFPAAGYKAGENHNYAGSQCVFWSNALTAEGSTHAVNAFFEGNSLKLNAPPKGKGGTLWCGYPVRAVRQFFLSIDTRDVSCNRDQTTLTFSVSGNSKWVASISGEGASVSPASGEGAALLTITLPVNDTEENMYYDVRVESPDVASPAGFRITQFGVMPEFSIDGENGTVVDWDDGTPFTVRLNASHNVSWTAAVRMDGSIVQDAIIQPAAGSGSTDIQVSLPAWYDTEREGMQEVVITTDNAKIPEERQNLVFSVTRSRCTQIPFGFSWGSTFFAALKAAFDADNTAASYTVCNTTVTPRTPGTLTVNSQYISKNLTLSFQSAVDGDAILHIKASVANGSSTKRIAVNLNGVRVGSLDNNTSSAQMMEEDIRINGVKKGDTITVTMSDSNNHKLYSMSYNKAE